ncbi:MAG TPA: ribosome assembly RNA-binding protein YhbY [Symbiobacteriaceae bacterium]|nr:ribosome assembly RNA-binding protein YhbY [Symbiobacteriaceae bacterium]
MELKGKQKRFLRAMGVTMDPILTVGKDGVSDNTIRQAEGALLARELIKGRVLTTAPEGVDDTARSIADATGADLVQTMGRNFLLYRPNPEKRIIELP